MSSEEQESEDRRFRIIVGGPPNSGKSTFVEDLKRALEDEEVDVDSVDFDVWPPTLDLIQGKESSEQRASHKKREVTEKDIDDAKSRLERASLVHQVVLMDGPGKISEQGAVLYRSATHSIIVCQEAAESEGKDWAKFLSSLELEPVAVVLTRLEGSQDEERLEPGPPITALLIGLNRQPRVTPVIRRLASLVRRRLGV